jgi:tRNA nucleotidyltransferase (CCA-adding enzyme)
VETELYKSMLNLSEYEDRLIKWPKLSYTKLITRSEIWALFCYLLKVGKVDSFLKQWKLPTKIIKDAAMIVEGLFHLQSYAWSPYFMYKNGKDYTLSIERCYSILNCLSVEERVNQRLHEFLSLPLTSRSDLSITGNELMKWGNNQPGPWIAEALTAVEEAILSGELENNQDEIKEWLVQCNRL